MHISQQQPPFDFFFDDVFFLDDLSFLSFFLELTGAGASIGACSTTAAGAASTTADAAAGGAACGYSVMDMISDCERGFPDITSWNRACGTFNWPPDGVW